MKLKFLLLLILSGSGLAAAALQDSPSEPDFIAEKDVAVPMRDGVDCVRMSCGPMAKAHFPSWYTARHTAKSSR